MDGIGRYSINVLSGLANRFPDIQFVIIGFRSDEKYADLIPQVPNVSCHFVPIHKKFYKLMSLIYPINLQRFVPFDIDLYLSTDFVFFPLLSARKYVTTIHDLAFIDVPQTVNRSNRVFLSRLVPRSIKISSAVAVVSRFTKERVCSKYEKEIGAKRYLIVPNGVDQRFFDAPDETEVIALRERYGLPSKFILAVGTREPRKNLNYLFESFNILPERVRAERPLVIIGKPGWGSVSAPVDPHVIFTGYVDDSDLPKLYHMASLFVFPSLYEGFGIPVLEAMAASAPVVATNIPSVKEFAGNTIRYVELDNKKDFSHVLEWEIGADTLRAQERARTFTWNRTIQELSDYLEDTLT